MTDQTVPKNVESETNLSPDLQRTVMGSVPGVGNMGVSTTGTAPLNERALEAAAKSKYGEDRNASASPDIWPDWEDRANESREMYREEIAVPVAAYLAALPEPAERPSLMSGPRFSTDELQKLRRIVESGTPLARNTVLRLIESAFMEATK